MIQSRKSVNNDTSVIHTSNNDTSVIHTSNNDTSVIHTSNNDTSVIHTSNNNTSVIHTSNNEKSVIHTSNNDTRLYISKEQIRQTKRFLPTYYINNNNNTISRNILEGNELTTFLEKCRRYSLSISDIERITPGNSLDVVFIHNNILNDIKKNIYTNTLYTPKEVFGVYKVSFTKTYGLQGNVDRYNSNVQILELYVEIDSIWFPTKNGRIKYNNKTIHWKDLPLNTKVGLQGLMIPWKILALYPSKIYLI